MKCPTCARNQKVKYGLVCSCGYRFIFNPKDTQTLGLTDGKFVAAANRASQNGTVAFTDNQLYAAYAAKLKSPRKALLAAAFIVGLVGLLVLLASPVVGFMIMVAAAILFAFSLAARAQSLTRKQFLVAIEKWLDAGKDIDGLIREPGLQHPPDNWNEHDIYDYGVERILVVQRDLLVDLMVRNGQHAEQRMLVVSLSGYPDYIQPHVNRLLNERDDLPVFLLHDADAAGVQMEQQVRNSWLALGNHPVIDMGFFPEDFQKLKRTQNFENQKSERSLPADALMFGALVTGMGACFATRATFAQELMREHQNQMNSGSSFG